MTTTITLDERAARALELLRRQAIAQGISLDQYLVVLADATTPPAATRSPHDLSASEFEQLLEELAITTSPLPPLPADLTRADFYDDHD